MKRKALIASLLLASTIGLVGCGTKKTSSSQSQSTNSISETNSSLSNESSSNLSSESSSSSEDSSSSLPDNYEEVETEINFSNDKYEAHTISEDEVESCFTLLATSEIRTRTKTWTDPENSSNNMTYSKSLKIGKSSAGLKVTVNGTGKLSFAVQNGSSGVDSRIVVISKEDGTTINKIIPGSVAAGSDYPEYPDGSPVVMVEIEVTDGVYTINRDGGTIDIYYAKLSVISEISAESGFEISNEGETEYVEGQQYDASKISLNAVYENGKRTAISSDSEDVIIDSSAVNTAVPGVYQVSVKYKNYNAQTIDVVVYQLNDITLGFNKIIQGSNSTAGNGQYINNTVRQVYASGSSFNHDNLTVIANCVHPTNESETKDFIMEDSYTVECPTFDSTTDGTYAVEVKLTMNNKEKTNSYKVHVVTANPSEVNDVVQVKVDSSYSETIGAISEGYNMFSTIQQALDYLENLGSPYDTKEKLLYIAAGQYDEKIEIAIPNLHIIGESRDTVKIEWDSLVGIADEGGFVHVTDSTATINIRDEAINCQIEKVTISNFFNSEANFEERFGANYGEHRALALLVQADKFILDNAKLLGYQDTVEFFTGRQVVTNTYISGTTDFIFGTNNTTYFNGCEIHSIDNAKNNGGYITAFKGCNKGDSDAITYGAIFDDCDFTADSQTLANKKTSMGRTWGKYAAVMVMNSRIGAHVSTAASTGGSKDERYVAMNGGSPTQDTVQFKEYNNTGDGAITSSIAGVSVVDKETADNYNDFSIIFGTLNGNLTYSDAWDYTLA